SFATSWLSEKLSKTISLKAGTEDTSSLLTNTTKFHVQCAARPTTLICLLSTHRGTSKASSPRHLTSAQSNLTRSNRSNKAQDTRVENTAVLTFGNLFGISGSLEWTPVPLRRQPEGFPMSVYECHEKPTLQYPKKTLQRT